MIEKLKRDLKSEADEKIQLEKKIADLEEQITDLWTVKQTQDSVLEKLRIDLKGEADEKSQLKQKVADLEAMRFTLNR